MVTTHVLFTVAYVTVAYRKTMRSIVQLLIIKGFTWGEVQTIGNPNKILIVAIFLRYFKFLYFYEIIIYYILYAINQ